MTIGTIHSDRLSGTLGGVGTDRGNRALPFHHVTMSPYATEPYPDAADLTSPLKDFLKRQEHAALVAFLIEQTPTHNAVQQRLRRWRGAGQPGA